VRVRAGVFACVCTWLHSDVRAFVSAGETPQRNFRQVFMQPWTTTDQVWGLKRTCLHVCVCVCVHVRLMYCAYKRACFNAPFCMSRNIENIVQYDQCAHKYMWYGIKSRGIRSILI